MHRQKRIIHRAVQPLLISLIVLLTTSISHALLSSDGRSEVIIDIVYSNSKEPESPENGFIQLLDSELYLAGFDVNIIEDTGIKPRQYLIENSSTDYLITDIFFLSEGNVFTAILFRQHSPSSGIKFTSDETRNLADQILSYLTSEDEVRERAEFHLGTETSTETEDARFNYHLSRGLSYLLTTNEIDRAIREFELAAGENPSRIEPYINLANCYDRIGNYKKAREQIERGEAIDRDNNSLKHHKALIAFSEKNFDEGIRILESLSEKNATFLTNLAYGYLKTNQTKKHAETLREIVRLKYPEELSSYAERRIEYLERKERELERKSQVLSWSLSISLIGLAFIGIIALITIVIRKMSKETSRLEEYLSPGNLLAFKLQLAAVTVSGLFSILAVLVPRLLGS